MPTSTSSARYPRYTGAAQATGRKPTQEDAYAVQSALVPAAVLGESQ